MMKSDECFESDLKLQVPKHFVWLDVFQGGHITAPNSYFESITVQQTAPGTFK